MILHSIKFNEFRAFKDTELKFGKYITAIAGQNATGKSTLLGIIGNLFELKKQDGVPLLQNQFRTEWSEIFKASNSYDKRGSNIYSINLSLFEKPNEVYEEVPFRATWQDNDTRYRLLPKRKVGEKISAAKMPKPVIYLGLSRLFPIGEINQDLKLKTPQLKDKEKEWVVNSYKDILRLTEDVRDLKSIQGTNVKTGVGISTDNYDYLVNSSGEDNIGQIILAVLSFKQLKEKNGDFNGGLLLIDEFEATLHPAVQINLFKFLLTQARNLNLQVVFTTHSMTLLEHLAPRVEHNKQGNMNDIELVYLSTANIKLTIDQNPPLQQIKLDLHHSCSVKEKSNKKILVYTEDREARWFLEKIINEHLDKVRLLNINMGDEQLLKLRREDMDYFSTVMFVLDGDVPSSEIDANNVIKLPGEKRPEEVFYDFLVRLTKEPEHEFWYTRLARSNNFTIQYFMDNDPYSYEGKDREKFKEWFSEHYNLFDQLELFDYWKAENRESVEKFEDNFIKLFNRLVKINAIPEISIIR